MLIESVSPFASRCLQSARSRLPASLAFSSASAASSALAASAEASISLCTWRSISFALSSGELSALSRSGGAAPRPPWPSGSNAADCAACDLDW